eukprot:3274929-Amphidinium_carterae.7
MLQGLRRGRGLANKVKAGQVAQNTQTLRKRKAQVCCGFPMKANKTLSIAQLHLPSVRLLISAVMHFATYFKETKSNMFCVTWDKVLDKAEHKDKRVAGLWRAWVRANTYGCSGRPSLSELGASYRAARESNNPALLDLQKLSAPATQAKLSGKKGGSFGPTSQQLQRHITGERKKKLWERSLQMQALQKFEEKIGEQQVASLQGRLPELRPIAQDLKAVPSSFGLSYVLPALGNDKASAAVAYANQTRKSNLVQGGQQTTACRRAGMCLCSPSGRITQAVRNAFLQLLKQVFGDKIRKQLLAHAEVVLHTWCSSQCLSCAEEPTIKHNWWHVGAMSFKPYRPTLLALVFDDREEGLQTGVEHRQALKEIAGNAV